MKVSILNWTEYSAVMYFDSLPLTPCDCNVFEDRRAGTAERGQITRPILTALENSASFQCHFSFENDCFLSIFQEI